MIQIYVNLIKKELRKLEDVPVSIRAEVKEQLEKEA